MPKSKPNGCLNRIGVPACLIGTIDPPSIPSNLHSCSSGLPHRSVMTKASKWIDNRILQLWTIKYNNSCILGTRIFWKKLRTDSSSDGQITSKKGVFLIFPRDFRCANFFGQIFGTFWHVRCKSGGVLLIRWIEDRENRHHCPLRHLAMLLLFLHGPCGCMTCQS